MKIKQIISYLEELAAPDLQEDYDNAGLITGNEDWSCAGVLCTLDVTEAVVTEAIQKKCNLIVSHHPIVFKPIRKLVGNSYVQRTLIEAIKNNIAIYAIHTNVDNIVQGVNGAMAKLIGLNENSISVLAPKKHMLCKLYTYVPQSHAEQVRTALFNAGAGAIGDYKECSFNLGGTGTFKPLPGTDPFIGTAGGKREEVPEIKIETLFPFYRAKKVLNALFEAHPYEEVAYEIIRLENDDNSLGAGLIGELGQSCTEKAFLSLIKKRFNLRVIRHTTLLNKPVKKVALCGGSGSFLLGKAINAGADVFVTADLKYHEFFDADHKILVLDIGHWESEQFTVDLLVNYLQGKIPTFAVLKTEENTNPVHNFV